MVDQLLDGQLTLQLVELDSPLLQLTLFLFVDSLIAAGCHLIVLGEHLEDGDSRAETVADVPCRDLVAQRERRACKYIVVEDLNDSVLRVLVGKVHARELVVEGLQLDVVLANPRAAALCRRVAVELAVEGIEVEVCLLAVNDFHRIHRTPEEDGIRGAAGQIAHAEIGPCQGLAFLGLGAGRAFNHFAFVFCLCTAASFVGGLHGRHDDFVHLRNLSLAAARVADEVHLRVHPLLLAVEMTIPAACHQRAEHGSGRKHPAQFVVVVHEFSFSKPFQLIKYLIEIINKDKDILILDFFSGSATTAHAVMQQNAEDGGNRKFIMVQVKEDLPEGTPDFKTIPEIAKERIRRAGKKIKEEHPEAKDLDIGFRVFKCDESNYKNVAFTPKDYSQESLELFVDNIKEDRSDLDLLFDCMLRWGITLDLPMTKTKVAGCTIHNVNEGALVACFDGVVTEAVIDAIAEMYPAKVVFRDSSFEEAAQKMNIFELFKQKCGWDEQEVRNNVRVI